MYLLIYSVALFCISFLCHLIIWRFHIPKSPIVVLLLIFYSILLSGLSFLWYYLPESIFFNNLLFTYSHIFFFFTALTLSYCFVYLGLIDDSPSLIIIMNIINAGQNGLSKTELGKSINDDNFIKPRLVFLEKEKMVYNLDEKYILAPKGRRLLSIFIFFQKLMRISLIPG